jgi:hypothetical protein
MHKHTGNVTNLPFDLVTALDVSYVSALEGSEFRVQIDELQAT